MQKRVMSEEELFLATLRTLTNIGYGRMIQIVSHEWYRHDPDGALLANTCYGLLDGDERAAYEGIAKGDRLFATD